jgi:hypothetical protein
MNVITPPEGMDPGQYPGLTCVFLAGGITGCPNWQTLLLGMLSYKPEADKLCLFNPRRKDFPIGDPNAASEQIRWEHLYLRLANAVSFWFPKESICPIVLYELGTWSSKMDTESFTLSGVPRVTQKPIVVGMDREYPRRQDVEIQTSLVRPEVEIVYSLEALAEQICRLT